MSNPSIAEKESNVTKSPFTAPWEVSVTTTDVVAFVVNGLVRA
jgi:hypothetical protein